MAFSFEARNDPFREALVQMLYGAYSSRAIVRGFLLGSEASIYYANRTISNIFSRRKSNVERYKDAVDAIATIDLFFERIFRYERQILNETAAAGALPTRDCVYPHCTNK